MLLLYLTVAVSLLKLVVLESIVEKKLLVVSPVLVRELIGTSIGRLAVL